jgi:hypothetical protein
LDLGSNGTLELQFNFAEHCTPVGLLWWRFSWILGQRRICRGTAEFMFRQVWWLEVARDSPLNPQLRSFKLLISKSWRLPCATRCFKTLGWDFVMRTSNFGKIPVEWDQICPSWEALQSCLSPDEKQQNEKFLLVSDEVGVVPAMQKPPFQRGRLNVEADLCTFFFPLSLSMSLFSD